MKLRMVKESSMARMVMMILTSIPPPKKTGRPGGLIASRGKKTHWLRELAARNQPAKYQARAPITTTNRQPTPRQAGLSARFFLRSRSCWLNIHDPPRRPILASPCCRCRRLRMLRLLSQPGRGLECLKEGVVAGAAAQVAGDRLSNFIRGWPWALQQQAGARHQESRGAVAALHPPGFDEALLDGVQRSVGRQALHRDDLCSMGAGGRPPAGHHRHSLQQCRAGPRLPPRPRPPCPAPPA